MTKLNQSVEEGNTVLDNQFLNQSGLLNLSQIEAQETQNSVDALAISGEKNLNTLAGM